MFHHRAQISATTSGTGSAAADIPDRLENVFDGPHKETYATLRALSSSIGKPVDEIIAQLQRLAARSDG
jgi:hypothetical protein